MAKVLRDYPSVALRPEEIDGRLDFGRIFGRLAPVHIEVGSGKGTFLVNQAKSQADVNFLGIERASRYYRFAVDRIGRWNLTNVRIIRTDASHLIAENVADSSVDCFHVYFPDPWPKKRHHKRRFLNDTNAEQLIRCLKPGGTIRVATDHSEYFEQMRGVLAARAQVLEEIEFMPNAGAQIGEWVGSNFERKYLKESRGIFTIAVRKREVVDRQD